MLKRPSKLQTAIDFEKTESKQPSKKGLELLAPAKSKPFESCASKKGKDAHAAMRSKSIPLSAQLQRATSMREGACILCGWLAWLVIEAVHEITNEPLPRLVELMNGFPGLQRRMEQIRKKKQGGEHWSIKGWTSASISLEVQATSNSGIAVALGWQHSMESVWIKSGIAL